MSNERFTTVWRIYGNCGDLTLSDKFVLADSMEEALAAARRALDTKSIIWKIEQLGQGIRQPFERVLTIDGDDWGTTQIGQPVYALRSTNELAEDLNSVVVGDGE